MKAEIQKLDGLGRRLQIEVPAQTVNAALERMYQQVQKIAKFKGFREGKAPMNMVKTEYKQKVEYDVAEQMIREYYDKAVDANQLEPVNFPSIQFDGLKENEPLKFSATFEVRPEIKLKKYKGLDVETEKLVIPEDAVDKILEDIQKSKANVAPVLEIRRAQNGDMAIIDFDGFIDGKPLQGGSAKEHMLELGSNQFIEGFEEGIVGMNPGDSKTLNLKFPENYQSKDIAGKPVEFNVVLKELKKKVLPELDDEFAKSIGSHTSLQHLKDEIKKDVVAGEEKRVKEDTKTRILHALVDANSFDVPQSMLTEQKQMIIEDVNQKMTQDGMTPEQFQEYKTKWDDEFTKSAEFVIRSSMLVNAIAKEENLLCTDEDVNQRMEKYAQQSGIELEKIKAFYNKPENRSRLRFQITEEKVIELLMANSKLKEVNRDKLKPLSK